MVIPMLPRFELPAFAAEEEEIVIDLPVYPGGKPSKVLEYDCGNGVTHENFVPKSYMTVVTQTNAAQFLEYCDALEGKGFTANGPVKQIASDADGDPNLFASYTDKDSKYKVYTYYLPFYQETRIIVDTQEDTVEGFVYNPQTGKTVEPMICMWGLSVSENGYDITTTTEYSTGKRNCGALIVIRMPDNSLFINDGGDLEQWSDEACDAFLAFCRELTGTAEGEKMVINTWFLSHAHSDHFRGFPRFMSMYHDQFDLKNIMYNIDIERTNTSRDIHQVMQMVSSYYTDVRYYKPHTGETIIIDGVTIDVLYTVEDRYLPDAQGNLITDYPFDKNGNKVQSSDYGGTYRDYFYEKDDEGHT